jgi:hypothetical protein
MIKTFKHKGLKQYYETGSTRGIQSKHASRLRMQLAAMVMYICLIMRITTNGYVQPAASR